MQEVAFRRSASHRPQNLLHWRPDGDTHCLATCHKDSVQILNLDSDWKLQQTRELCLTDRTCSVTQAQVLQIESQIILILITEKNVQFHDMRRDAVLYTFVPNEETACGETVENFAAGICHLGYFIFIGLATGGLLVISRLDDGCLVFEDVVAGARVSAVTDVTADDCNVVTGDADGCIAVWEPDGQRILRIEVQFDAGANQFPVTSILARNALIVAAFGSGHVRVYGIMQRRLLSEVHAHNGWINDMAISRVHATQKSLNQSFLIATAGDDSRIRVFAVKSDFPWITHQVDHCLRNQQVVGVTFLDNSRKLAAISYDSCTLSFF